VRTLRRLVPSFIALLLVVFAPGAARAADLTVHVLDVGQGDAIFIRSPAGKTVLVDAGTPESAHRLTSRLRELVPGQIDLVLMTHPHADHIGGMEAVIRDIGARIFMEPGFDHPSPIYSNVLKAVEAKNVQLKVGKAGNNVELGGGAVMHLLAPKDPFFHGTRSDANANSIVIRLTYGKTAFYLAADSEAETEKRILESGEDLSADVYKVAHHGSRHSSTAELLEKIHPKIAVVSVGAGNDYGHPTRQALDRLEAAHAEVLRTDLDGEVVLHSDGEKVTYGTEKGGGLALADVKAAETIETPTPAPRPEPKKAAAKPPPPPTPVPTPKGKTINLTGGGGGDEGGAAERPSSAGGYVASRNSDVFHKPECNNAGRIKPANLLRFKTREEAAASKRPAKDCNP
jgi:beta-lactamase superfamily II metal-dependent hydrolase